MFLNSPRALNERLPRLPCRGRGAGQGALEAAADVAVCFALEGATGFVCPGFGVASDTGDRDGVQCPV